MVDSHPRSFSPPTNPTFLFLLSAISPRSTPASSQAADSLATPPLLEIADAAGLTPLAVAIICCVGIPKLPSFALHATAMDSSVRFRVLEKLIEEGSNVEASAGKHSLDQPLLVAIGGHQPVVVSMLLRAGADGRATCLGSRMSALHLAVATSQPDMVTLLLQAGVGVAAPPSGMSPLQLACSQALPHTKTISLLLAHGAQPNLPDERGVRPLQMIPYIDVHSDGSVGFATPIPPRVSHAPSRPN